MKNQPKYPLYIVSKGRAESRLTSKALERMKVPYRIVIEESDYKDYSAVIDKSKILILPEKYLDEYDVFDDLGRTKSVGPGAARNFVWEHSISEGHKSHWVMDDNITCFYRFNKNLKIKVYSGALFRAMEDFVDRYENIAMAGPHYDFFAVQNTKYPPFSLNTRIYSCNMILNESPFRWRGRYNEDTDLSLRMLKEGWCTMQFYAFLQGKVKTQVLGGGNTEEFYAHEGTLPKSQMLQDMHPDVAKVKWRFGRWHHYVDYLPFKANELKKIKNLKISENIDNYGMSLKTGITK